jgi:multiple sugar transport system substrate-binding protein
MRPRFRRGLLARGLAIAALAGALAAAGCGSSDDGGSGGDGGPVKVTFWHGQNDITQRALERLVDQFNASHPQIVVDANSGGVLADEMLTKLTAGLAGGSYPDVAYVFGSDLANIARSDKVQDLTESVRAAEWRWDDFWPGERDGASVEGRVRAVPALADNLGIIYNKQLFDDAGVPYPAADWTWDDFRGVARQLTNADEGRFGTSWPGAGGEDTTWRLWPMLWQQGGDILSADETRAEFNSPAGVRALELIGAMAAGDKSVFVDSDPNGERAIRLFQSGKLAMMEAGPWVLPDVIAARIDYGAQRLPGFDGDHTTVSGSDNWVLFDNGEARARAAREFVQWLTAPRQDLAWVEATQSLPLRQSTSRTPEYRRLAQKIPGTDVFAMSLETARSRPSLEVYPEISKAVGEAVVAVMLGRAQAQDALDAAARRADAVLAGAGAGG